MEPITTPIVAILPPENLEAELLLLDADLGTAETSAWKVGDRLVKLSQNPYNMELRQIAKRYVDANGIAQNGRSYARLSEFRSLAEKVKPEDRNPAVPFYVYQTVVKTAKAIERNAKKELGVDYKVDIQQEIAEIRQQGPDRASSRQVAVAMAAKSRDALMPLRFANAEKAIAEAPTEIINERHHGDYVEVLRKMPEGSIKILFCDPPYFGYKHDTLEFSSSASNDYSENNTAEGAKATTLPVFELAATRLVKGGVILLWQAGAFLSPDIISEADKYGFRVGYPIVWDKIRPQPGDQVSPISVSVEFCWPIYRKTDQLWNVNMKKRSQVHYANEVMAKESKTNAWPLVHQSAYTMIEKHNFEKPMQSNIDLMEIFSIEGDLIFETHGCSGGMSVAAHHGKRNWVYCEMHDANFKLGFTRIQDAINGVERSKPDADPDAEAGELVPA